MKLLKAVFLLICIGCFSCKEKSSQKDSVEKAAIEADSVFVHEDGSICHAQSPINILSFAQKDGKHNITFSFKDEINKVENLGHTVQVDFEPGSTIIADNESFEFKQAHFHTPSEHLVDGVTYPMEMHMVNTLQGQKEGEETEFLVIGFLFKMGKGNKFIQEILDAVPAEEHSAKEVDMGSIRVSDLIQGSDSDLIGHYYHYKGSLTTPPYSETVRWYVTKKIYEASPEQITAILNIEGLNARHIQGVNNRIIEAE